ncbi:cyanophycin synthetase [Massilia atriviolacea]|uniref:Cyanophycin synthetase n=1 Tax=Massilia atriviolacea TaxID=2495579 RepID=A0A430HFH1_9BURK|nr:cyanophycin synthetase [Massilia atriviolacea]RSZ56259.1 cyanophycin synthetase [Massilia atriviolacea]
MHIIEQRVLRGPNRWSRLTCLQTVIDIGDMPAIGPAFASALLAQLPGMAQRRSYTTIAHAVELAALELQAVAGTPVSFAATASIGNVGNVGNVGNMRWRIVVAYQREAVAIEAMALALDMVRAAARADTPDWSERVDALREVAERGAVGTSTAAVLDAARARGIPVLRLTDEANLFQLGWGSRQKRLQATVTGATSTIAVGIASNKQLTKTLLEQGGIPVPKGDVATTADEAVALAARLRYPVTVKPLDANQGKGVTTECHDQEAVRSAFDFARQFGRRVIVERFIAGRDYRLLVTGGRLAAASLRRPPAITGDGASTVRALVELENRNPARGDGHANILTRLRLDELALALLAEQGYTPDSVLPAGLEVRLRGNANLSTGGTAEDVTDLVHPSTREMCIRAARIIGLDVAGIDVICGDIGLCLRAQRGAVIEVNAAPGIRMHEYPSQGQARQAGDAIALAMFGQGDGRIPVIAVTGTNGKTTTSLMIAHAARLAGLCTGVTTTEGVFIDGHRIIEGDCAGYHSARTVLATPTVDIAVLETARGGILKRGLAFDRCAVAVVLNVSADHLGLDGVETVAELAGVKAVVASAASRAVVLNADDRLCVAMSAQVSAEVERIFFSMEPDNPVLLRHLDNGGRAAYYQDDALILADGSRRLELLRAGRMPSSLDGHARYNIANALAASAALMGADFTHAQIATALSTFVSDAGNNPLRSNIYSAQGVTIVVDYAHNPAAYAAMASMAQSLSGARRIAVLTCPGDRREADLLDIGHTCADGFDELFVYEADPRGRASGETAEKILDGARRAGKEERLLHAIVPVSEAFAAAMACCRPGDVLVFACGSAATALRETARYVDQRVGAPAAAPSVHQATIALE